MDSKYCPGCLRNLPLSSFLASDGLGGRVFATCISCASDVAYMALFLTRHALESAEQHSGKA